jgi:hypothetical protein
MAEDDDTDDDDEIWAQMCGPHRPEGRHFR